MDDLQSKISAVMENPDMMAKIMSLAKSLESPQPEVKSDRPPASPMPEIDFSMLQKLSGLAGQSHIDKNQKNLLQALNPYLSKQRISKLERAMRAAKMAGMATAILPNLNLGR